MPNPRSLRSVRGVDRSQCRPATFRSRNGANDPRGATISSLGRNLPSDDMVAPLGSLAPFRDLKVAGLHWLLSTPLTERRLRGFGITDLYRAFYEHRDVFLISDDGLNSLLNQYLG